jgi:hypothetical protein
MLFSMFFHFLFSVELTFEGYMYKSTNMTCLSSFASSYSPAIKTLNAHLQNELLLRHLFGNWLFLGFDFQCEDLCMAFLLMFIAGSLWIPLYSLFRGYTTSYRVCLICYVLQRLSKLFIAGADAPRVVYSAESMLLFIGRNRSPRCV